MNSFMHRSAWVAIGLIAIVIAAMIPFLSGCSDRIDDSGSPAGTQSSTVLDRTNPLVKAVMDVQDLNTPQLMQNPVVVGTATGLTEDGRLAIMVYTKEDVAVRSKDKNVSSNWLPESIDGIPVVVEVTGPIKAMDGSPATAHRVKQTPPVQLGTSGGWRYDLANGYCCGGTSGSLVKVGTTQYVLSNYHVFWGDIVAGGNGRVATAGDPVIQPGLIDVNCNANNAQNVANLSGHGSLPGANVDVGYAQVISGMVRTDGAILDIGTISATTQSAFIGQAVKKSGRTTGLGRGSVTALNGAFTIGYENECAGGAAFNKSYTGQIVISNRRCTLLNGGDSGSLLVEDVTTNPRAVGLLFAGSVTCNPKAIAIANPIGAVLSWIGGDAGGSASMVGQ